MAEAITTRALNRALLARQLLLERSSMSALQVIEHLVGLQAQAPNPPYFGLWTRLENFRPDDLSELIRTRKAVRIALMRSTIHLVSAADCLALRPLVQMVIDRSTSGGYGRKLAGMDMRALARAGRKLVDEKPLTYRALGRLLQMKWPERDGVALANAVRALVPLVQVPPRGLWGERGASAHTSAQKWLKRAPRPKLALEQMLLRYLAAFGPARVKDMQKWSGLTRLSEVVSRMESQLITLRDQRGNLLYDLPDAPRPAADFPAPARLLPEWDNILLAHAERTRIVADDHSARVMTSNGLIPGTVLVDGFVRGMWKVKREKKDAATLIVEFFGRVTKRDRSEVAEEGMRLLDFAAPDARRRTIEFLQPV